MQPQNLADTVTTSGFTQLQSLTSDERFEASLVQTDAGLLVLKTLKAAADGAAMLVSTQRQAAVTHPSLRKLQGAGTLPDGRLYVLVEPVEGVGLANEVPAEQLVEGALAWCGALAALHGAGLRAGALTGTDLVLGRRPVLDASLAFLTPDATEASDVRALVRALQAVADPTLAQAVGEPEDLATLTTRLEAFRAPHARTAVSSSAPEKSEGVDPELTGSLLGPWQLESVLGEGAMGRVYKARHSRIGRQAAVKVLKPEHAVSAELVQRFIQEAQAVNAIKNEHIVEVYDFGELPGPAGAPLVYCVMELLEGEALSQTLERGPIAVRRVASVGAQLGRALHAAHQLGVIHRDIKPENIFLRRRPGSDGGSGDYVKVLDFGVAKLLKPIGDLPQSGTVAGMVVGTPEYMAPEQALGTAVDLRSDLYAVGLVLYELLTGQQPFRGDTFGKLVVEITQRPPPPIPPASRLGEPIPRGLVNVVLKCLQKDPDARYESGELLAAALDPYASSAPPADPTPATVDEGPLELPRSRTPRLVAAGLAVVALGVAAALLLGGEGSPTAPAVDAATALTAATQDPAPAPSPSPETPAPAAEPQPITLEVTSSPAGATVTRADTGETLGVTPLSATLAPAGVTALKLTLQGYEPEARDVNLSHSVTVGIDLRPRKPAVPEAKRPAKKKAKVSPNGTVDPFDE